VESGEGKEKGQTTGGSGKYGIHAYTCQLTLVVGYLLWCLVTVVCFDSRSQNKEKDRQCGGEREEKGGNSDE